MASGSSFESTPEMLRYEQRRLHERVAELEKRRDELLKKLETAPEAPPDYGDEVGQMMAALMPGPDEPREENRDDINTDLYHVSEELHSLVSEVSRIDDKVAKLPPPAPGAVPGPTPEGSAPVGAPTMTPFETPPQWEPDVPPDPSSRDDASSSQGGQSADDITFTVPSPSGETVVTIETPDPVTGLQPVEPEAVVVGGSVSVGASQPPAEALTMDSGPAPADQTTPQGTVVAPQQLGELLENPLPTRDSSEAQDDPVGVLTRDSGGDGSTDGFTVPPTRSETTVTLDTGDLTKPTDAATREVTTDTGAAASGARPAPAYLNYTISTATGSPSTVVPDAPVEGVNLNLGKVEVNYDPETSSPTDATDGPAGARRWPVVAGAVVLAVAAIIGIVVGTEGSSKPSPPIHGSATSGNSSLGVSGTSGSINATDAATSFPTTSQYSSIGVVPSSAVVPENLQLASLTESQKSAFADAGFQFGDYQSFRNATLTAPGSSQSPTGSPPESGIIGGELQVFGFSASPPRSLVSGFATSLPSYQPITIPITSTPSGAGCIGLQSAGTVVATLIVCSKGNALYLTQVEFGGSDTTTATRDALILAKDFAAGAGSTTATPGATGSAAPGASANSIIISSNELSISTPQPGENVCQSGGTLHVNIQIVGVAAGTPVQVRLSGEGVPSSLTFTVDPKQPFTDAFPVTGGGVWRDDIVSIGGQPPPSSDAEATAPFAC